MGQIRLICYILAVRQETFITLFTVPRSWRKWFSQRCSTNCDATQQTFTTDQYLVCVMVRFFNFNFCEKIFNFSKKNSQKIWKINYFLPKIKIENSGRDTHYILLLSKCLVISVKTGRAVFAESRAPWPHVEFGAVHSMKLAFYCSELQWLETICNEPQSNQGFRQYIVLLLKY